MVLSTTPSPQSPSKSIIFSTNGDEDSGENSGEDSGEDSGEVSGEDCTSGKLMNSALKTMNFLLKMMDFLFKMMNHQSLCGFHSASPAQKYC